MRVEADTSPGAGMSELRAVAKKSAEEAIEHTRSTGRTWLKLNNRGLAETPAGITSLTNLQRIEMFRNNLESVPHDLSALTDLPELDLSDNNFGEFPTPVLDIATLDLYEIESLEALVLPGNPHLPSVEIPAQKLPNLATLHTDDTIEGL